MADFVTITEAAKYVGVSKQTIRNMIRDGRLPALSVGRLKVIDKFNLIGLKPSPRGPKPSQRTSIQQPEQAKSMAA